MSLGQIGGMGLALQNPKVRLAVQEREFIDKLLENPGPRLKKFLLESLNFSTKMRQHEIDLLKKLEKIRQKHEGEKYQNVVHAFYKKYDLPYNPEFAKKGNADFKKCQPNIVYKSLSIGGKL